MMASRQKSSGFTMIELMMTIAIGSIVMMLAIPSFRYVTNSNRIAAEVNGLLGDMQLARSEAIKTGQTVTVCVSNDGANCTGETTWQKGWIVFSDVNGNGVFDTGSDTLLRVQRTFSSSDTFAASNNLTLVTFNREGYAGGVANGTLITLQDSTHTSAWTRCLAINLIGQITTERVDGITPCT
jgi:type IV fimbrial biogenesis protein FimT